MTRVSAFVRSRAGLLTVVLLLVGGMLTLLPPADARQICGFRPIIRNYYNDAAHDVLVGQRGIDCDCNSVSWGTTSSYVMVDQLCCTVNTC